MKKLLVLIPVALLFIACKKDCSMDNATPRNMDFSGRWKVEEYALQVNYDSSEVRGRHTFEIQLNPEGNGRLIHSSIGNTDDMYWYYQSYNSTMNIVTYYSSPSGLLSQIRYSFKVDPASTEDYQNWVQDSINPYYYNLNRAYRNWILKR